MFQHLILLCALTALACCATNMYNEHVPFRDWVSVVLEAVSHPMSEIYEGALFETKTPPQPQWWGDVPSTRVVSNAICDASAAVPVGGPDEPNQSTMMFAWGQWVDHDLDLLATDPTKPWPIPVPPGDVFTAPIGFARAKTTPHGYRNEISARIDLSSVYGQHGLRTGVGGTLRTSSWGRLLPRNDDLEYHMEAPPNFTPQQLRRLFVAGDVRANEQALLTAIHTFFALEHNRLCRGISNTWRLLFGAPLSDDRIFHAARTINVGQAQAVTYQEYLPRLLGIDPLALPACYHGKPRIFLDFATVGFRLGHSQLPSALPYRTRHAAGEVPLTDVFFNPELLASIGWEGFVGAVRESKSKVV
eukprot:gnl/Dysnectes_brevis/4493_a6059_243.p1 GENE.gnl/Dysnectes_brevis/4493_a6059_243~~gnl/Dysnectes_brevis/4493_a6059_243.p1  ORF type:complete len:360 (+),score=148.55 gnl/Dysnectes_brevis/4493_a6059_243:831-1910(+)